MLTTVYLLRDIYSILMESTPRDVRSKDLLRDLRRVDGVHCVSCLHIWQVRKPPAQSSAQTHKAPDSMIQLIRCVGTVHSWRPARSA